VFKSNREKRWKEKNDTRSDEKAAVVPDQCGLGKHGATAERRGKHSDRLEGSKAEGGTTVTPKSKGGMRPDRVMFQKKFGKVKYKRTGRKSHFVKHNHRATV